MSEYRIELDVYSGPLDLLLFLIKRDEVDIHDIPVAHITEQYLQYIATLRELDINLAGEFLVMAATLMEIKSALLMPREANGEESELSPAEDPTDPRFELIQQLLAYKRYKDAASRLEERRDEFAARFPRQAPMPKEQAKDALLLDIEDVSLWDLVEAFGRMMDQVGNLRMTHDVVADDTPVELHMADLVDRLEHEGPMTLQAVFAGRDRSDMVGLFLAMLELVRERRLAVKQEERGGEISLELRERQPVDSNEPDPDDPSQGATPHPIDVTDAEQFDWPDEQTRQRYVRRQERRARGERIDEDAEFEEDLRRIEAEEAGTISESDDDVPDDT
jgi:segregation and condensation protein A